jgi:bifunctional DNA-binding transcriptional regulator/antitoxin component of YhaV-PrlF toxin-antitoxin module
MTATVSDQMQVTLPREVCLELGIAPGVSLDFQARDGKLEATKVTDSFTQIYTAERNAEEMVIQKGCSVEVPEDFPK